MTSLTREEARLMAEAVVAVRCAREHQKTIAELSERLYGKLGDEAARANDPNCRKLEAFDELLEASKWALQVLDARCPTAPGEHPPAGILRDAIAKAEGKS